ncbi:MAG: radical SAM protein [Clostridia bacterium]|nr:radical SAM protein [Clostridia bacterium]
MRYYNIPIFVPHEGCPFQCVFCNQKRITGSDTSVTPEIVTKTIEEYLSTIPCGNRRIEAAFFGGSFTGISAEKQESLLKAAYEFVKNGKIDGIRLSTRPDYISEEILDRLLQYGVTTVELGVQSMDDAVLIASGRGHTAETVENAVKLIKKYPFNLGLQMMIGLPEDTKEKSIKTAEKIIDLAPDFVRIYPTLVLKDTYLEKLYNTGEYEAWSVEKTVDTLKEILPMFSKKCIEVIRVALAVTEEISPENALIAGPFHPAIRELAEGEIYFDKICGFLDKDSSKRVFSVNECEISKAVGNGKKNIKRIKEKYGFEIKIKPSKSLKKGEITAWKDEQDCI